MTCANPPVRTRFRNTMDTIVLIKSPADEKVAPPQPACSSTPQLTTRGVHIRLPLPDASFVRPICCSLGDAGGSRLGSPRIGSPVAGRPPRAADGRTDHAGAAPAPGLGGIERSGPDPTRGRLRRPRCTLDRRARRTRSLTRSRHRGAALRDLRTRRRYQPDQPSHVPRQDHGVPRARLVPAWSPSSVLNPARHSRRGHLPLRSFS